MRSILLVEDDENDVFFMQRAVQQAKIALPLKVVSDGQAALEYLAGKGEYADRVQYPMPCLTLLDLKLPKVPGLDVLERLRAEPGLRHLIVIVLTSSKDNRDIERAYRLGANAFLVKPADAKKLAEMVEDLRDFWLRHNEPPYHAA